MVDRTLDKKFEAIIHAFPAVLPTGARQVGNGIVLSLKKQVAHIDKGIFTLPIYNL